MPSLGMCELPKELFAPNKWIIQLIPRIVGARSICSTIPTYYSTKLLGLVFPEYSNPTKASRHLYLRMTVAQVGYKSGSMEN